MMSILLYLSYSGQMHMYEIQHTPEHCIFPFLVQCLQHLYLLHEKFLQFDWLGAVVFQLNLKYLHVKITKPLRVVV